MPGFEPGTSGGGFSLDAGVRIESHDRVGLERLIRYCARPPFALARLHLVGGRSDQVLYILPKPDLAGRTALGLSSQAREAATPASGPECPSPLQVGRSARTDL